jgi:hypothetical protein
MSAKALLADPRKWQHRAMRDFWGIVFDYVDFHDFLVLRSLCKLFWEHSMTNQRHWYNWLQRCGKPGGFRYELATHHKYNCKVYDSGGLCKDHRHYGDIQAVPLILKTVPLSKQVLGQCAKRNQRVLNATMGKAMQERDKFEQMAYIAKVTMEQTAQKLLLVDKLVEKHRSKRKKTHIEIGFSNLPDDN